MKVANLYHKRGLNDSQPYTTVCFDNDPKWVNFDFAAAFRARKDGIEGGETGVKSFRERKSSIEGGEMGIKSRAASRRAGEELQRLSDEAIEELEAASKRKIALVSIVFVPVVLAIIGLQFNIALDPFFKSPSTNGEFVEYAQRTKKEIEAAPKATVVDFNDLLKEP